MARKPIELELSGGKTQRQRLWELIRATEGKEFEQLDVTPGDITNDTVKEYLAALTNGGFLVVTREAKPNHVRRRWKLARDPGVEAPRLRKNGKPVTQGSGNEAIWGAMQALGIFTIRVLASMAGVSEPTVKKYISAMKKAGYVTVDREDRHGGGKGIAIQAQYRLVRSKVHGPRPPMITRRKVVYDPNINEFVWQQPEEEVLEEADK